MIPNRTNNSDSEESNVRDKLYSKILETIVLDTKSDRNLKSAFFWIVIITFAIICLISSVAILVIAIRGSNSIEDIATVVAAFGSILGSVVALPTIIAKHLFPPNGEEIRFGFMKDIKRFDIDNHNDEYQIDESDIFNSEDIDDAESDTENPAEDLN